MSTSERLEREVEQCRARISSSLDELRARMTPGQIVDQLVDYARDASGGMFFRNLQRQVIENPIPAAMVGAGLAWLAVATGRNATSTPSNLRGQPGETMDQARASAQEWAGRAQETASSAGNQISESASQFADRGRRAAAGLQDAAASAYQTGAETANRAASAVRDSAASLRGRAASASQSIGSLFREQPLVLAGVGLAIGALLGAALPETEAEDRLMGQASGEIKERTGDVAGEQYEKAKTVAEHAYEEAKQETEKQTSGSDSGPQRRAEAEGGPTLVPFSDETAMHQGGFGPAENVGGNS
ncbi:MAG TPA: DUF3618 domain-containing protein [Xanthobacteraceae bacterium]|jgi:ElaB/YqjD/DUF883 family membrane-anchored ribosome-binding protein